MGNSPSTSCSSHQSEISRFEVPDSIPNGDLIAHLLKVGLSHEVAQFLVSNWGAFGMDGNLSSHQFKSQAERFRKNLNLIVDCDYFLDRVYAIMDENHDGTVTRTEFLNAVYELYNGNDQHFTDLSFDVYSREKPGEEITFQDLKTVIKSLWQDGLREIMMEQPDDLFDLDEQVRELLPSELHYNNLTTTIFSSIIAMEPNIQHREASKTISKAAFHVWALTDPTMTVSLNEANKVLHFMIRKREPND